MPCWSLENQRFFLSFNQLASFRLGFLFYKQCFLFSKCKDMDQVHLEFNNGFLIFVVIDPHPHLVVLSWLVWISGMSEHKKG